MSNTPRTDLFASVSRATNEALDFARSLERENSVLVAQLDMAKQFLDARDAEVARWKAMLQGLLDAHEAEAGAYLTLQTAQDNYTDPSPELDAWERATIASSEAEKQARAALAHHRSRAKTVNNE